MNRVTGVLKDQFRRHLGRPLQSLSCAIGLTDFSPRLRRLRGAIVLLYHSVADTSNAKWIDPQNHVPADVFESQLEFLAKHRNVISLSQLVQLLQRGESADPRTVVITFDDGYLDNLHVAAPLLQRFALPATLFLPTGYIDRSENQWIDQLYCTFQFRTRTTLQLDANDDAVYDLQDPASLHGAYRAACDSLMSSAPETRRHLLSCIHEQLAPAHTPPSLTLSWDEVRMMAETYHTIEIGGHTVEHTDMTSVARDAALDEINRCAQRVEDEIGRRPTLFSFPYGRTNDDLRTLVRDAGYESACGSTGDKLVTGITNRFALPRVVAPPTMHRFNVLTSAANSGLWRKLGR